MNSINVIYHQQQQPEWIDKLQPFCDWLLARLEIDGWELNFAFVDRSTIQSYNSNFRGKDYPTDVLSFRRDCSTPEFAGNPGGDLLFSLDIIAANARKFSVPFANELNRTIIHGVLHLAGWDHDELEPEGEMLTLQESVLAQAIREKESIYVAVA